ncbi:hypothetical protein QQZ08_010677 [Neonectria magnoliae]|uniref:DUF6603 domain-containing protein n=1 Tax=Neonectria magnoliae TaxID=2732573 RepID=A0ABR1HF70_9HYPO
MALKGLLGVDTYQIGVPGGDCAIVLLVDQPPMRKRKDEESNHDYHHDVPFLNDDGHKGTVLRAILVDGGHDGRPGYYGKVAADKIEKTIQDIESKYEFTNYNGQKGLKFDAWIVTHWDRDHYCGALHLFWNSLLPDGTSSRIRFDNEGVGRTTLYCPTWDTTQLGQSTKFARGRHNLLGGFVLGPHQGWYICNPPKSSRHKLLSLTSLEYDNLRNGNETSRMFGTVVTGCDNLLGLDMFSGQLFNDSKDIPKFGSDDESYRITNVCAAFKTRFGNLGGEPSYGLTNGYTLLAEAKRPLLICIGAMGQVMGSVSKPITEATGDNYASIMMVIVWVPNTPTLNPSHVSLFSGGDAHMDTEDLVLQFLQGYQVEVIKAGHHGARTSTSARMLKMMRPNKFIISAGKEYGHPSWQLLAFLLAFFHSRQNDATFKYKSGASSFCHATRFPYYFTMYSDASKAPNNVHLNIQSYFDHRKSYNAFFDYLNNGYVDANLRNGCINNLWLSVIFGRDAERDLYEELLQYSPNHVVKFFLDENVSLLLDKIFLPYSVLPFGHIKQYNHRIHVSKLLVTVLRYHLQTIAPFPFNFNAEDLETREICCIIIHSRHDTILDGAVSYVYGTVYKSIVNYSTKGKAQWKLNKSTKQKPKPGSLLTPQKKGIGKKQKKKPSSKETKKKDLIVEQQRFETMMAEIEEQAPETFELNDISPRFCEQDDGGTADVTDALKELIPVGGPQDYFLHFRPSDGFLRESQLSSPGVGFVEYPDFDFFQTNPPSNPVQPYDDTYQFINQGYGQSYQDHFSVLAKTMLPAASFTKDETSLLIRGIAHYSEDQTRIEIPENEVLSSFLPESEDFMLFALWPGYSFRFDSPVAGNTQGSWNVLLAGNDQAVGMLGTLLQSGSHKGDKDGCILRRLELNCTLLHDRPLNAVPATRVDEMTMTLTVGHHTLVFSSHVQNLNSQFGLETNALNGLRLRNQEILLALDHIENFNSQSFTMADVFTLGEIKPPMWIKEALRAVKVELAGLDAKDKGAFYRNGCWLSPGDNFEITLRLQFRLQSDPELSKLSAAMGKLKTNGSFHVTAKRSASCSPLGDPITVKSEVGLETTISFSDGPQKETDASAHLFIREDTVELCVVRHTADSSMQNLFKWIIDNVDPGELFRNSKDAFEKALTSTAKTGQHETAKGSSKVDISWRSLSVVFDSRSVRRIHVCFEVGTSLGVEDGKMAGFSLDFTWMPTQWEVSGRFMPGGLNYSIGDEERLDPEWELSDWVPPLNKNLAPTLSIFHLDPTSTLNKDLVPSYIPTEITMASLRFGSEGIEFHALLKSRSATDPPVSGDTLPMVPMTKTSLLIATTYSFKEADRSNFGLLISGFIELPEFAPVTRTELQHNRGPPRLTATIKYAGDWEFSATASNIQIGSLVSLFGGEVEQADVKDLLGHLTLESMELKYSHQESKSSSLGLAATVLFKDYRFELKYGRQSGDNDADWALTMGLTDNGTAQKVKLASILQWLLGDSAEESFPTFLSEAAVSLSDASFTMSLTRKRTPDKSTLTLSTYFKIGDLVVQFARLQIRPASLGKDAKPTSRTIVRVAVNSLPRPPPLPLIGQIEQHFSVDVRWASGDLSIEEVNTLNTLTTFEKKKMLLTDNAKKDAACGQGVSFMLLADSQVIIATKPKKTKKAKVPSDETAPVLVEEKSEPTEMKPFPKRVNGVSITNVGLDYDVPQQKVKIKFSARATLGPLDGELINFTMGVRLPRSTEGDGIQLSDWNKLVIDMDLDGLSLGMTGSNLNVAGFLQRIREKREDMLIEGFEGGIGVKFKSYEFTAFGSYKGVKTGPGADEFVSLMVYGMMQGPILKTPYVEICGISGGFGLGSQLTLPHVSQIHTFPLLMGATPNAVETFAKLRGSDNGPRYITETNGSSWFAVGILATACETVDVSAVLTLPLSPNVSELSIVGTASARFPRDKPPEKALASIKLNFQGTIEITHGFLLFQGQISDGSFLLFNNCLLTGGFVVGAWFGPSPQAGDWCISIGGWHPAYIAPGHYPPPPPRLGIDWTCSNQLSLKGQAYAAVTPDALMGGVAVSVLYKTGCCGANFDFRADFILCMHPIHYDARVYVSASLWFELCFWGMRRKLSIPFGAELHVSGPPFGGDVYFDWCVVKIRVEFGRQQSKPRQLTLREFIDVCLKKSNTDTETDHVLSLEAGAVAPNKVSNEAQRPQTPWVVRGPALVFSVVSRVPSLAVDLPGALVPSKQMGGRILSRPMQLSANSQGLTASLTVQITRSGSNVTVKGFSFDIVQEKVPASLWGVYDDNSNAMLAGASRETTITHTTGLRIQPPVSHWSKQNPKVLALAKLAEPVTRTVDFKTDTVRSSALDARPRFNKPGQDNENAGFASATKALVGMRQKDRATPAQRMVVLKARNKRRATLVDQWAAIRGLTKPTEAESSTNQTTQEVPTQMIKSEVPLRYAKGLERFSHVAPRVTVE